MQSAGTRTPWHNIRQYTYSRSSRKVDKTRKIKRLKSQNIVRDPEVPADVAQVSEKLRLLRVNPPSKSTQAQNRSDTAQSERQRATSRRDR